LATGAGDFPALVVDSPDESTPESTPLLTSAGPMVTTASALLVVLGLFGGVVWLWQRYGEKPAAMGRVPDDVLQHLGSTGLDAKTRVTLLRVGHRILVLSQPQGGSPQTLAEIDDAEEVQRITNRCLGRPEIVGQRSPRSAPSLHAADRVA
jgi:flagellar biogenesis protein FliO